MRLTRAAGCVPGAVVVVCLGAAVAAAAQRTLDAATASRVDGAVQTVLARSGAPSASVAIVQGGAITYAKAYGTARVGPPPVRNRDPRAPRRSVGGPAGAAGADSRAAGNRATGGRPSEDRTPADRTAGNRAERVDPRASEYRRTGSRPEPRLRRANRRTSRTERSPCA